MAYIKLEDLQKFPIRQNHYDKENGNEHFICGIETVIEYAENLPTADIAEVKHGEWRSELQKRCDWRGKKQQYYVLNACSECHVAVDMRTPFCPNCGAKMDGGEE